MPAKLVTVRDRELIKTGKYALSTGEFEATADLIKSAIAAALLSTKMQNIHLYYAGPSHLALFLGHRLNATAPVQCYEWTGPGHYVPTCALCAAEPRVEINEPRGATRAEPQGGCS